MKPFIDFDAAVKDPTGLGAGLGDPTTFGLWIACFVAAFGGVLNRKQRQAFASVAGNRQPPKKKVREFWAIVGRRGGKTRMAALVCAYIALCCDWAGKLVAGEVGYVLCLSASRDQAKICFNYIRGFIEASPVFSEQVEKIVDEEIHLRNGVIIQTHVNNFRTIRGRTILAAIFDESAFWRDESSATPDVEVYRAVIPSIIASAGILIGISSAYRRAGLLYQRYRDFHGVDDPDVLVVRGKSLQFNPTLDAKLIAKAHEDDAEAARAEWDSEFRSDLSQFLDDEDINFSINSDRPKELRPDLSKTYAAFTDVSGGRHDGYVTCVGHRADERIIVDAIVRRNPPFDPAQQTEVFANLLKDFGIKEVTGDNFAAAWASTAWEKFGIRYQKAEKTKSQLYIDGLPAFTRRQIEIPNDETLIRELRMLERRTSRTGRDTVSDPAGNSTHDDSANALFGLIHLLRDRPRVYPIQIMAMNYH